MNDAVVVSMLWPKNQAVSVDLARQFSVDILAPPPLVTNDQIQAIEKCGRRFLALDASAAGVDTGAVQSDAQQMYARAMRSIEEHAAAIAGPQTGAKMSAAVLKAVSEKIGGAILTLRTLSAFASREKIVAILLNESETPSGKTVALWAKSNGIPVLVLSHGVGMGEVYTVTRDFVADYLLFVGERGTEPYEDVGFPRDRMIVCGNPAWDESSKKVSARESVRKQLESAAKLDMQLPTVVFGTTWNARLTSLHDVQIYEQTLRAFFAGCRALRDRGASFNAVVKDRPPNAQFGAAKSKEIAEEVGLDRYSYATGDMMTILVGSDLFVSYESSAFVEATIAGIPSIAIWAPSAFLTGPSLDRSDGIPYVPHDDPQSLADVMHRMLFDPTARAASLTLQQARLPHFTAPLDGRASERCAEAIGSRLDLRPVQHDTLVSFVMTEPGVIVDVGPSPSQAGSQLRTTFTGSKYINVTAEELTRSSTSFANADVIVLDGVLERMYDPWAFLRQLASLIPAAARVLVSILNVRNIEVINEMVQGDFTYGPGHRDVRQLRFFTRKTLTEMFEQTGYTIRQVRTVLDAATSVPKIPPGATFNVDLGRYSLEGITLTELDEFRTVSFLVEASAVKKS